MNSQKAENLLNLALDATEREREKAPELEIGFEPEGQIWELIVKYTGTLETIRELTESIVELQSGYAIITIREENLERFERLDVVEYIEKPKLLYFEITNGKRESCINSVQASPFFLSGKGVLVAILDSGIDYASPVFKNADGTTRIRAIWDQTIPGNPPQGYAIGTEYTKEQIDEALQKDTPAEQRAIVPSVDVSGHGTSVAAIAAGNGRGVEGNLRGVAYESEIIVVKLGNPRQGNFPKTTELMQAADYVVRKAIEWQIPVAINISFGNSYGSHDGTSLMERFLDEVAGRWKNVICVGTGNEATTSGHTSGTVTEYTETVVPFTIQKNQAATNIQIWKEYVDEISISLVSPAGVRVGPIQEVLGSQRFRLEGTEILLYYGKPSPYSVAQEIYLSFIPTETYLTEGVWKIELVAGKIVSGSYEMWFPGSSTVNVGTGFLYPSERTTLTIPSTASQVISVGAYDATTLAYAEFSGRGYTRYVEMTKPDLVAPGVDVMTVAPEGKTAVLSGTSFATPFVTGAAALLMEWGIVEGNDRFLYGEKMKAYLRRGARPLPGFTEYPNPQVGYGALCVRDSLPI